MKNLFKVLAIIALAAVIGFSFIACDDGNGSTHTHSWGAWRSNATQHWKECDCGEEYGRANHTFNGDICSVCNYNRSGGGVPTDPNSATYTSYDSEGNSYQLQISKGANNPGNGGDPGTGNSGLNGTWVNQAGEIWVFNNGSLTTIIDNVESVRGTYTTSGNNITVTISQVKGSVFGADATQMGLSPTQWYTESQFRTAVINAFVNAGYIQSQAAAAVDAILEEYPLFEEMTGPYSLSGNTLTIDGAVLTSQGGRSAAAVSFSRAAYSPQNNDPYQLTIKSASGSIIGTSTGYVATVTVNGATYTITLNHNSSNNTVSVTVSGNGISYFSGNISLDNGSIYSNPGTLTTTKPGTSNPGSGYVSVANTNGQLTINGLSKYNGQWVYAVALPILNDDDYDDLMLLAGAAATTSTFTLERISGGSATLKVWKLTDVDDNSSRLDSYSGNDRNLGIVVAIVNKSTITNAEAEQLTSDGNFSYFPDWLIGGGMSFSGVNFTNGRATCTPGMLFDIADIPGYPGGEYPGGEYPGDGFPSEWFYGEGWPPSNVLSNYGIGGLSQPSGSDFQWSSVNAGYTDALSIGFTATNATATTLKIWFSSNGWTQSMEVTAEGMNILQWTKGSSRVIYTMDISDNDAALMVMK